MGETVEHAWLAAPDEREQMGHMAGILWLLSAAVVLLAALLPGGASESFTVMAAVGIYAIVFGVRASRT